VSPEPERNASHDANGVDLDQVREMLALSPEQRLARVEEFVQSMLEIRDLNEAGSIR